MPSDETVDLSGSLEDYLETVYQLVQKQRFARVKEIATARQVKAGSVSQALKRLAELGLVNYVRREYVDLTELGEEHARRVFAKHRLLERFFSEILKMPAGAAAEEACAIEHSLSAEGMDRLVHFFEFLAACPKAPLDFLERFHKCPLVNGDTPGQSSSTICGHCDGGCQPARQLVQCSILELDIGVLARVTRVVAPDTIRQRLLDLGVLPNAAIVLERMDVDAGSVWVRLDGNSVRLRTGEAKAVQVAV
ncbi:DtxR family transcriptional regulator [Myxococcota bacterium]